MVLLPCIRVIDPPVRQRPVSPLNHGSEAHLALDADGTVWVVRDLLGANAVLSEALYWHLATAIGARVAEGAVFDEEGSPSWASRYVFPCRHWTGDDARSTEGNATLGAMIALDAVAALADRHEGNLLVVPNRGRDDVVLIDNANSFLGTAADLVRAADEHLLPDLRCHIRTLPIESLVRPALATAEALAALPRARVERMVQNACLVTRTAEIATISEALLDRLEIAVELAQGHLANLSTHR